MAGRLHHLHGVTLAAHTSVMARDFARLLTRKLGLPVIARPTEGAAENIKLLESGEIQLAFVTLGIAQQGWNGTGGWTGGRQFRTARALFPMYDTPFQFIVTSDFSLHSITDLSGKQVGIGPEGGTGGVYTPLMFKALNMTAPFVTGSWADLAVQLSTRRLDALVVVAGPPVPEVAELEKKGNVRYLVLTPSQKVSLRVALPEMTTSFIAAGTYPSVRRDYQTLGIYNFAVARPDLPESSAYAIVEAVFTNPDEMMQIYCSGRDRCRQFHAQHGPAVPRWSGALVQQQCCRWQSSG